MKNHKRLFIPLLLLLAVSGTACSMRRPDVAHSDYLFVHFIDVGYGDSILVEFPDGGKMLVDGGTRKGGKKVSDYLKARGIKRLDLVVVTHPHPDHMEGLFTVLHNFEAGEIIANEDISRSKYYTTLFKIAKERNISFKQAKRGDTINLFKGVGIEVIHPDKITDNWNNDSLVMKLTYKKVSILLAADTGKEVYDKLPRHDKKRLRSTIVKVPHHGRSRGDGLARASSPKVAVVSVGPRISKGPSEEILTQYTSLQIPLLRTDKKGTIVIKTDGKRLWY